MCVANQKHFFAELASQTKSLDRTLIISLYFYEPQKFFLMTCCLNLLYKF